jgi:hypothetical protein
MIDYLLLLLFLYLRDLLFSCLLVPVVHLSDLDLLDDALLGVLLTPAEDRLAKATLSNNLLKAVFIHAWVNQIALNLRVIVSKI